MANYATFANFGNPLAPGWQQRNLVTVKAPNGQSWQVHKAAAPYFTGFLKELSAAGYNPTSSGGFNYRPIRGSTRISQHGFGTAVDINAARNPLGSRSTDMPANIGELANKYNLEWGGTWKSRPDPMHFEFRGEGGKVYALPEDMQGAAPGQASPTSYATPDGGGFKLPEGYTPMAAPPDLTPLLAQAAEQSAMSSALSGLSGLGQAFARNTAPAAAPPPMPRMALQTGPQLGPLAPQFAGLEPVAVPRSKTLADLLAGLGAR
jgi:hypothetical protein